MAGRKKLKEVKRDGKIFDNHKDTWDYLPEEIWSEILQRLPAKSLLGCRCVKKSWYYLIQSPLFVTMHSNYQKTHHKYLLAQFGSISLSLHFDHVKMEDYYMIHDLSLDEPDWCGVADNGLICLSTRDYFENNRRICIYNPAIRKIKIVPHHPRQPTSNMMRLAFGFSPKANDFKVVRVVGEFGGYVDDDDDDDDRFTVAYVYSLATNSWKTIDTDKCIVMKYVSTTDWVFLNDTAYFRAETFNNEEDIILCCDTYKNIMREISLPESCEIDYGGDFHYSIAPYGKTIAFFHKDSTCSSFNMWILQDEVSWEKKITFNLPTIGEFWDWNVIGMRNNGEVIVYDLHDDTLMSYNADKDEAKIFMDWDQWSSSGCGWSPPVLRINSFAESLVLIDT